MEQEAVTPTKEDNETHKQDNQQEVLEMPDCEYNNRLEEMSRNRA